MGWGWGAMWGTSENIVNIMMKLLCSRMWNCIFLLFLCTGMFEGIEKWEANASIGSSIRDVGVKHGG